MTEVRTKAEAKARGEVFFFTGVPCFHGHIAKRYVSIGMCFECRRKYERERISADPKRHRDKQRNWHAANRQKSREISRKAKEKNPEYFRQFTANWNATHREHQRLATKAWRARNPGAGLIYHHARRARILGAGGTYTLADVDEIFRLQGRKCAYCRKVLSRRTRTIDHIKPIAKGGRNDRQNIQIACLPCNLHKRAKDPLDFARQKGMLL